RPAGLGGQPAGEAAGVDLGVDVRPRPRDDVETHVGGGLQGEVHVAYAGEVVHALRGRVVAPVEVQGDGVVPVRLHLLQDVAPQARAGQPERVELAGPDHRPLPVDHQRVWIPGDRVRRTGRPGGYVRGGTTRRDGDQQHGESGR